MFWFVYSRFIKSFYDLRNACVYDQKIVLWHKHNEDSRWLSEVPGIGPLIATVLVASIGDVKNFKSGWQVRMYGCNLYLLVRRIKCLANGNVHVRTLLIKFTKCKAD